MGVMLRATTNTLPCYFPCRILWLDREGTVPPIARMEHMSDQMLINSDISLIEVVVMSLSSDTLSALTHSMLADVHGLYRMPRDRGGSLPEDSVLSLNSQDLHEVCDP